MRLDCHFALVVRIDSSAHSEGCWSVMWRRLLWPGKPRWVFIPLGLYSSAWRGGWSVMSRKLLWSRKLRWILIFYAGSLFAKQKTTLDRYF
jgi:hypothetical protein